jgi:NAD(P)-dependent dehydrogenase (short-subunit alcohol dehydrogenase family)
MHNKIALVTGASSGIGQATAERLAKAGYKVYGTSRRVAPTSQRSFEMLPLDVTKEESVDASLGACACCAGSRPPTCWTRGFEKICSSKHRRLSGNPIIKK